MIKYKYTLQIKLFRQDHEVWMFNEFLNVENYIFFEIICSWMCSEKYLKSWPPCRFGQRLCTIT